MGVPHGAGSTRPGARRRAGQQRRHPGAAGNREVALSGARPPRGDRTGTDLRPVSTEYRTAVLGQPGACLPGCPASGGGRGRHPVACRPSWSGRCDWAETSRDRAPGGGDVRSHAPEGRSPKPAESPRSAARGSGRPGRGARAHPDQQRGFRSPGPRRRAAPGAGNRGQRGSRAFYPREPDSVPGNRQRVRSAHRGRGVYYPRGGRSARRTDSTRTIASRRRGAIAVRSGGDRSHGSRRGRAALLGRRVLPDRQLVAAPRSGRGARARSVPDGRPTPVYPLGGGREGADRRIPARRLRPSRVHARVSDLAGAVVRVRRRAPVLAAQSDQPGAEPLRAL